jgi:hypothetical protein
LVSRRLSGRLVWRLAGYGCRNYRLFLLAQACPCLVPCLCGVVGSAVLLATDRWFYFVAGEVKARCGTVLYKNVLYPAISLYDAEEAHKLSIWVRVAMALHAS